MPREQLSFIQLVTGAYSIGADRRLSTALYGLTADGAVYQHTAAGWKALDMHEARISSPRRNAISIIDTAVTDDDVPW